MLTGTTDDYIFLNENGNFAALDFTYVEGIKSSVYELVYRAKFTTDLEAITQLADKCDAFFTNFPKFIGVDFVCAVPAHKDKIHDLPRILAQEISKRHALPTITDSFSFAKSKQSSRELPLDDKKKNLEQAGITYNGNSLAGKTVLLIDDTVQSKTTMIHVSKILKKHDLQAIFGLAMVKTRSDTDNV